MDLNTLADLVGILDALLIIALGLVWREWRKSELEIKILLKEQIDSNANMISQYNSFEAVIKQLGEILKE